MAVQEIVGNPTKKITEDYRHLQMYKEGDKDKAIAYFLRTNENTFVSTVKRVSNPMYQEDLLGDIQLMMVKLLEEQKLIPSNSERYSFRRIFILRMKREFSRTVIAMKREPIPASSIRIANTSNRHADSSVSNLEEATTSRRSESRFTHPFAWDGMESNPERAVMAGREISLCHKILVRMAVTDKEKAGVAEYLFQDKSQKQVTENFGITARRLWYLVKKYKTKIKNEVTLEDLGELQ